MYSLYNQGLPGVDGREGIPGLPGAKVESDSHYITANLTCLGHSHEGIAWIIILHSEAEMALSFFLSVSPQGNTGKPGVPGEIGLQGLAVSMTLDRKLLWLTVIGLKPSELYNIKAGGICIAGFGLTSALN